MGGGAREAVPSQPNHHPKSPSLNAITWGARIVTHEFWGEGRGGDTYIHSLAQSHIDSDKDDPWKVNCIGIRRDDRWTLKTWLDNVAVGGPECGPMSPGDPGSLSSCYEKYWATVRYEASMLWQLWPCLVFLLSFRPAVLLWGLPLKRNAGCRPANELCLQSDPPQQAGPNVSSHSLEFQCLINSNKTPVDTQTHISQLLYKKQIKKLWNPFLSFKISWHLSGIKYSALAKMA